MPYSRAGGSLSTLSRGGRSLSSTPGSNIAVYREFLLKLLKCLFGVALKYIYAVGNYLCHLENLYLVHLKHFWI